MDEVKEGANRVEVIREAMRKAKDPSTLTWSELVRLVNALTIERKEVE